MRERVCVCACLCESLCAWEWVCVMFLFLNIHLYWSNSVWQTVPRRQKIALCCRASERWSTTDWSRPPQHSECTRALIIIIVDQEKRTSSYIYIRQNFSHQSNLDGLQRNRKVAGKILGRRGLCKALVRLHHITLVRKSIYSCSLLSKLRNTHTNQDEGHTRRPRWPERWRDAPRGHQLLMPKHTKSQEIHGTHLKQYSSKENKTPSSLWR